MDFIMGGTLFPNQPMANLHCPGTSNSFEENKGGKKKLRKRTGTITTATTQSLNTQFDEKSEGLCSSAKDTRRSSMIVLISSDHHPLPFVWDPKIKTKGSREC